MDLALNQQTTINLNPGDVLTLRNNPSTDEALITIVSGANLNSGTRIPHKGSQDYKFDVTARIVVQCTKGSLWFNKTDALLVAGVKPAAPQLVQDVVQSQIDSPTVAMIQDTNTIYRLSSAPFTRYQSNGSTLSQVGSGGSAGSTTYVDLTASRNLLAADIGKQIRNQSASDYVVTVRNSATEVTAGNAAWVAGQVVALSRTGAGLASFAAADGTVTINNVGTKVAAQNDTPLVLQCQSVGVSGQDTWNVL